MERNLTQELFDWARDWLLIAPLPTWASLLIGRVFFDHVTVASSFAVGSCLAFAIGVLYVYVDDLPSVAWRGHAQPAWRAAGVAFPLFQFLISAPAVLMLGTLTFAEYEGTAYDELDVFIIAAAFAVLAGVLSLASIFCKRAFARESGV